MEKWGQNWKNGDFGGIQEQQFQFFPRRLKHPVYTFLYEISEEISKTNNFDIFSNILPALCLSPSKFCGKF